MMKTNLVLKPLPALLALAFFSALSALPAAHAQQSTAEQAQKAGSVHISGQRSSLRRALALQEKADHIVSAISSDEIGQLPDKNAAEALARLPGVAVQRDQGEGRYVVIRGLSAQYNSVTMNGALLPSPEASQRGVALDILPAGMIRSLEVYKTLLPEHDANSLGGTVEVKSLSAFDLAGQTLNTSLGLGRDGQSGASNPQAGLLWAQRFAAGRLGLAFGASVEKRAFSSKNVETGGAWKEGKLSNLEWRDYAPTRERGALALNLDWRPESGRQWYLRSFLARFADDEVRDRLTLSNFSLNEGESGSARAERRLRSRKYTQDLQSLAVGTEQKWDEWKLNLAAGFSRATEDTPESINDARFRASGNIAGISFYDTQVPHLQGPASLQDPGKYQLNALTLQARDSRDREQHLRLDLSRNLAQWDTELKFGLKWSRREKSNNTEQWAFKSSKPGPGYWGSGPLQMSAFSGAPLNHPYAALGNAISPDLIRARLAGLSRAEARLLAESSLNDYQMQEDGDAAYVQSTTQRGKWTWIGGVRYQSTRFAAQGVQLSEGKLRALSFARDEVRVLPSLQMRYDLDQETSLRGAYTQAVVRPNFNQLAPGVNLISPTEASFGNPQLQSMRAHNLDFGFERMLGGDGALSAYLFSKDIRNFTYATNLAGSGQWAGYTSALGYANGDKAQIYGLELSYQQALRTLPAPWNGLLLGANLSFSHGHAEVARYDSASRGLRTRRIDFPGHARRNANLNLGYENGQWSARLALNYKSSYLLELGEDILQAQQERHVAAQSQVDLSLNWKLSPRLQLGLEIANLNNEKYYVYQGSKAYNAQYEEYGRTYKLSLKGSWL